MIPVIALLVGGFLSLALVGLARRYPPGRERRVYAVGIVIAALVYVGFGVAGGASAPWLALEILGVLLYGAAAWGGLRGRLWLLALGWAAHVAWDVLLHLSGAGAEYMPHWYPWLCVSFDLVMAGAVLASTRRGDTDLRGTA
ncbi:MAG TPA: DUF6010 family protein [Pyrinomonadaceae bacterium]